MLLIDFSLLFSLLLSSIDSLFWLFLLLHCCSIKQTTPHLFHSFVNYFLFFVMFIYNVNSGESIIIYNPGFVVVVLVGRSVVRRFAFVDIYIYIRSIIKCKYDCNSCYCYSLIFIEPILEE